MTYTGEWETVGDPQQRTERQAVPDGWIVRVWSDVLPDVDSFSFVGPPALEFVPDKGHHWKIQQPKVTA